MGCCVGKSAEVAPDGQNGEVSELHCTLRPSFYGIEGEATRHSLKSHRSTKLLSQNMMTGVTGHGPQTLDCIPEIYFTSSHFMLLHCSTSRHRAAGNAEMSFGSFYTYCSCLAWAPLACSPSFMVLGPARLPSRRLHNDRKLTLMIDVQQPSAPNWHSLLLSL